jgi:peptide/nickel transport system permease protein
MSATLLGDRLVAARTITSGVLGHRSLILGGAISGLAVLLAAIGPWIVPYSPTSAVAGAQLLAPSEAHWLGTDSVGMDVFSRIVAAPRTDVVIALSATLLALTVGVPAGAIAGYYRGIWSEILMRISDLIQSFPVFILAMATVVVLGHGLTGLVLVLALVNAPIYVRLVRAELLTLRERAFVDAAISSGVPGHWVIIRHLLPNAIGPIASQTSITVGLAMLLTAGLSFIGAGVRVPTPEWGSMIAVGAPNIVTGQWWPSVFPGIALSLTVLGFALVGEAILLLTDPTRRVR